MIEILFGCFLISWLVLAVFARERITVLGIVPNRRRGLEFLIGLLFMAVIAVVNFTWQAYLQGGSYQVNPDYGLGKLLGSAYWVLQAVVLEELVFRGVFLYLMIRYVGVVKACLISAVIFGVYHWFSYGVFGSRLVLMVYVFLVTGCSGWMFAFAFAKTKSLYVSVGLHLGWNLVAAIVFSSGPLGNQWLVKSTDAVPQTGWQTLLFFTLQAIVVPGLVTWYLQKKYQSSTKHRGSAH